MTIRSRRLTSLSILPGAGLAVLLLAQFPGQTAPPDAPGRAEGDCPKSRSPTGLVQPFDQAEEVKYPWGWIRWLMSSKIDPQAEMTLGIVYVKPHQRNPMHVHPNCAEFLHMLSGSCEHLVGDKWVTLEAGDTIRIPAGVRHVARTLDQPMRAVIVYSAGERQFEVVDDAPSAAPDRR